MFMVPCQKRRHVVRKKKDGTREESYRCAHSATPTYRQEVCEHDCAACTMRKPLIQIAGCAPKPPELAEYEQPIYGKNGEIVYKLVDGKDPPPVPDGYKRSQDNPWVFESMWPECPKRHFSNDLMPNGALKVLPYCEILQRGVDLETCKQCMLDLVGIDGSLDEDVVMVPENVEYPGMPTQLSNYWTAVKRWIKAGRPKRSDKEVARIHSQFCSKCDWYDKEMQRCKGCGCKVKPQGAALLNKIKMATETCPRKFW